MIGGRSFNWRLSEGRSGVVRRSVGGRTMIVWGNAYVSVNFIVDVDIHAEIGSMFYG